jgi:hypothetical protein
LYAVIRIVVGHEYSLQTTDAPEPVHASYPGEFIYFRAFEQLDVIHRVSVGGFHLHIGQDEAAQVANGTNTATIAGATSETVIVVLA